MVKVYLNGLMDENILVLGIKANKMVLGFIIKQMDLKKLESGRMVKR
jgi:hypothetical protein